MQGSAGETYSWHFSEFMFYMNNHKDTVTGQVHPLRADDATTNGLPQQETAFPHGKNGSGRV